MVMRVMTFTAVAISTNMLYHVLLNPIARNPDPIKFAVNNKHINPDTHVTHTEERSDSSTQ